MATAENIALAPEISVSGPEPTIRFGWLFLLVHLAVWTVVPALANRNLTLDSVEMWYWGQQSEWGYSKHPPLPAWCAHALTSLLGKQEIVLYFGSQCAVVLAMWAVWKLARRWLAPWPALLCILLLEACYFFNWKTVQFNNNTLNLPWWALSALMFHAALSWNRRRDWIATGIFLALGIYTKYDIAFLGLSMVALLLILPSARSLWRTAGPYLTAATTLALATPHLIWMVSSHFPTIQYAMVRSQHAGGILDHIVNPIVFFLSQTAAFLPAMFLLWPVFGNKWKLREWSSSPCTTRDFALFIGLGPFILYLLLSMATGAKLSAGWGAPLWMFWPLLLLTCFQPQPDTAKLRSAFYRVAVVGAIFPVVFAAERVVAPYLWQNWYHVSFPGQELGSTIQQIWHEEYASSVPWVGGEWWLAGNAAFYADDSPQVYADLDSHISPWASDEQLRTAGGVLVWTEDPKHPGAPAGWQERFPNLHALGVIELPYHTSAKVTPARLGLAVVPPNDQPIVASKFTLPLRR